MHCAVADTLRIGLTKGWVWFHPANGELRSDATGARLKRMGVKPGVSDIVLAGPPHGTMHVLELKARGQKPTEAQADFLAAVDVLGGRAEWTDSYETAIQILQAWGALRLRL